MFLNSHSVQVHPKPRGTNMDHTYLRYECADAFGLTIASTSSKAPVSNQILGFTNDGTKLLTVAGSFVAALPLKSALQPTWKLGHAQQLTGGVGTGRALNSDEVVCLDVSERQVATGWVDGAVRIFDLTDTNNSYSSRKAAHSLLEDDGSPLWESEPLLLNGHSGSPVRSVVFDSNCSRLASGGSDGTVVLWDIVAEMGIYRLLGHRGGITDISFLSRENFNGLISCSLDGLVKIWDLDGQCCVQTIASHRGEVWAGTCMPIKKSEGDDEQRWRLITGGHDGQVRVWSGNGSTTNDSDQAMRIVDDEGGEGTVAELKPVNTDDICHFMGSLTPPPNVAMSNEKILGIRYHHNGRYVGVLHGRHVDVYLIRSTQDSHKKRARRLKRRQEKSKKKSTSKGKKKRGILDDPESSDDDAPNSTVDELMDPELIKASDEFEYLTTVRASHKVRGFSFCPHKEKGELARIVCAMTTNALEIHALIRQHQGYVSPLIN